LLGALLASAPGGFAPFFDVHVGAPDKSGSTMKTADAGERTRIRVNGKACTPLLGSWSVAKPIEQLFNQY
jgi:hypothetical protein